MALRDNRRLRMTAARYVAAPVIVAALFVCGPSGVTTQLMSTLPAPPQAWGEGRPFDDLRTQVPDQPGADGSVGTEQQSKVPIIVTGSIAGLPVVPNGVDGAVSGIPASVLPAYQAAARALAQSLPGCKLTWPLLAGIGKVESSHASGGRVDAHGTTRGRILGPVLDGAPGMATIHDTDGGRYDGDAVWDRAVGPMQFIPGTWVRFAADGNHDGVSDPHNVYDAALAAGEYLCAGGADLSDPRGLVAAVLRYNHSMDYVAVVLRWMREYAQAAVRIPDRTGVVPPATDETGNVERTQQTPEQLTAELVTQTQPLETPSPQPTVGPWSPPPASTTPRPTSSIAPSPTPTQSSTTPTASVTSTSPTSSTTPTSSVTPSPTPTETTCPTPTSSPTLTPTPTPTPTLSPTPDPCATESTSPTPTPSSETSAPQSSDTATPVSPSPDGTASDGTTSDTATPSDTAAATPTAG